MVSLEQLIRQNRELRESIRANLGTHGVYVRNNRLWPVLYLALHVFRLNESIELLVEHSMARESGMLLRSMFEATVNVMWISLDPVRRLQRYADYQPVSAKRYRDLQKRLDKPPTYTEEQAKEYDRLAEEAKRRHGFKSGENWSGKTLKQMAEEVGWLERYETAYRIYSEILHSGVSSGGEFISQNDKGVMFINPSSIFSHAEPCMMEAYAYLATTFALVDTLADLGMQELMDKAMDDVSRLYESTKADNPL